MACICTAKGVAAFASWGMALVDPPGALLELLPVLLLAPAAVVVAGSEIVCLVTPDFPIASTVMVTLAAVNALEMEVVISVTDTVSRVPRTSVAFTVASDAGKVIV